MVAAVAESSHTRTEVRAAGPRERDERVTMFGLRWTDYEILLAIRGESAVPRMTYCNGVLELMSPSTIHETFKTSFSRLLEAWADEREWDFNGFGSWTIKRPGLDRGLEPDECYVLGIDPGERPDIAIEVVHTSGGLDKLDIYRAIGVPEVWRWEDERMTVFVLEEGAYVSGERSRLLPEVDVALLARLALEPNQRLAVKKLREHLRGAPDEP